MFGTISEIDQDDMLCRMHDKLESVSELIELEQRLSSGIEIDELLLDEKLVACVDLVMAEETDWISS